jgi:segregation and condensation protein B
MSHDTPELDGRIEALLFSSEIPLPARRLADLAGAARGEILAAIDRLNVFYGESGRAFRIAEIAGGHQMVTVPAHAELLAGLHKERIPTRLSRAALETLAIIAFKQPVTRAEIDRIRGVSASDGVLRHLLERKVVRIAGRAEAPGRPLLYGTTSEFLGYFGLPSLGDLPRREELEAMLADESAGGPPNPSEDPSPSELESHSGEESDDREGIPAP